MSVFADSDGCWDSEVDWGEKTLRIGRRRLLSRELGGEAGIVWSRDTVLCRLVACAPGGIMPVDNHGNRAPGLVSGASCGDTLRRSEH